MVQTSCALFNRDKTNNTPSITDTKVVTETVTLPGKVTVVGVKAPDSEIMKPCGRLTGQYIPSGPDIAGDDAVRTAAAWGKTSNDCRDKNLVLRGWIIGVVAAGDSPIVSDPP